MQECEEALEQPDKAAVPVWELLDLKFKALILETRRHRRSRPVGPTGRGKRSLPSSGGDTKQPGPLQPQQQTTYLKARGTNT